MVENQAKTRALWEDSCLFPETSTKNAVQEFHLCMWSTFNIPDLNANAYCRGDLPGIDAVCSAEHGELTAKGVDHVEDERLAEVGLGSGVLLPGRLAAATTCHQYAHYTIL